MKAQIIKEDGIVEHTLGGSATGVISIHVEGGISNLVGLVVIRGEFDKELSLLEARMVELTVLGPAYEGVYMDGGIGDSLMKSKTALTPRLLTHVMEILSLGWYALGEVETQLVYKQRYGEVVMKIPGSELQLFVFQLGYDLCYTHEHKGRSVSTLIHGLVLHTLLSNDCSTSNMDFLGSALKAAAVWVFWRDMDHLFIIRNWHNDEALSSLVIRSTSYIIMSLILQFMGAVRVCISSLGWTDMFFSCTYDGYFAHPWKTMWSWRVICC